MIAFTFPFQGTNYELTLSMPSGAYSSHYDVMHGGWYWGQYVKYSNGWKLYLNNKSEQHLGVAQYDLEDAIKKALADYTPPAA